MLLGNKVFFIVIVIVKHVAMEIDVVYSFYFYAVMALVCPGFDGVFSVRIID